MAVTWEGDYISPTLPQKTPSLCHSAVLFNSREPGLYPCGTLIQVEAHLYPSPWSCLLVLPLLNTVRESLKSVFRVFKFSAAHQGLCMQDPRLRAWGELGEICLGCFMFTPNSFSPRGEL